MLVAYVSNDTCVAHEKQSKKGMQIFRGKKVLTNHSRVQIIKCICTIKPKVSTIH